MYIMTILEATDELLLSATNCLNELNVILSLTTLIKLILSEELIIINQLLTILYNRRVCCILSSLNNQ